jgi:hypothetical protein
MRRLRMRGAVSPFPLYAFVAWFLIKHSDNFTFALFCET